MTLSDKWGKISDVFEGYKTHIANVATPVVQYAAYKRHWPIEVHAVLLTVTCSLSSLFRMFAKKPGPFGGPVSAVLKDESK